MQLDVRRDCTHFAPESGDLVGEHARGRNFDRVVPVVIVVAERVREVQDGHLRDLRGVLCHVEVGRLDGSLGYGVRHEEEVEFAIDDFGLLDEALVNVGALRWVFDEVLAGVT